MATGNLRRQPRHRGSADRRGCLGEGRTPAAPACRLHRRLPAESSLLSAEGRRWLIALAALKDARESTVVRVAGLEADGAHEIAREVQAAGLAQLRDGRWYPESRAAAAQVLEHLEEKDRKEVLRLAADALFTDEGANVDPWRMAQILAAAEERERAIECALRAAQQVERRKYSSESAERLAFVLRILGRRDPRRAAVRLRHGQALDAIGLYLAASRAYAGAAVSTKDRSMRADALSSQALALGRSLRLGASKSTAQRARKLARSIGRPVAEARAIHALVVSAYHQRDLARALELAEAATVAYRSAADSVGEIEGLRMIASIKSELRSPDAVHSFEKALDAYSAAGLEAESIRARMGLAHALRRSGEMQRARNVAEEACRLARHEGNLQLEAQARETLLFLAVERGEFSGAVAMAEDLETLARHLGDVIVAARIRETLAISLLLAGRPAEAIERLRELFEDPRLEKSTDRLDFTRIVASQAAIALPIPDLARCKPMLETAIANFRSRRDKRNLLYALVTEMERRAIPECGDPFDPIRVEFEAVAQGAGLNLEAEVLCRASPGEYACTSESRRPGGGIRGVG